MSIIYDFWGSRPMGNTNVGIGAAVPPSQKRLIEMLKPKLGKKVSYQGYDLSGYYREKWSEQLKFLGSGTTNPKLSKNKRISFIMYMQPARYGKIKKAAGGFQNTCKNASPECIRTCLNLSGSAQYLDQKLLARTKRTALYYYDREYFLTKLALEIFKAANSNKGIEVAIRVNGTSDLPIVPEMEALGLLQDLPDNVVFYDYTKNPESMNSGAGHGWGFRRLKNKAKTPYVVTFSRSEINQKDALKVLKGGGIVAIPFTNFSGMKERSKEQIKKMVDGKKVNTGKYKDPDYPIKGAYDLPRTWFGYKVLNGDMKDDYMLDLAFGLEKEKLSRGNGVVLGLHVKDVFNTKTKKKMNFELKKDGFLVVCDSFNCRVG